MMNRRGLTLLETLIVLGIIVMFLAISVPLFTRFTESTKLDTATRSITSAMRSARGYAITNNKDFYVIFDDTSDPNEYFISEDGAGPLEDKQSLPAGISFAGINFTSDELIFSSTGRASESNTLVLNDNSGGSKTVRVTKTTGAVKIE